MLAIAAFTLALAACGGSDEAALTVFQVKHCSVHVFFARTATHAQEEVVGTKLRHDSRVLRVTYVSKAQALRKMKKQFPALDLHTVPNNPLPDAFVAVPAHLADVPGIVASLHSPGVATIKHGLPPFCPA